jgi:hypothetical protein
VTRVVKVMKRKKRRKETWREKCYEMQMESDQQGAN